MYEDLDNLIAILIVVSLISFPLGIWKLVEIIIWIIQHVSVSLV